mgnify:CR=1 FL=1
MAPPAVILVLGDQLTPGRGALRAARPGTDLVVMAEVAAESLYVRHNRHKLVLVLAAMRHCRDELRAQGFEVLYFALEEGLACLTDAVTAGCDRLGSPHLRCCEPGEYRVRELLEHHAAHNGIELAWVQDDRFLATLDEFEQWAQGRKQLRMEYFYRLMRRKHNVLLDAQGEPEGGRWNYDRENRRGWRGQLPIPPRPLPQVDAITREVIALVRQHFPDNPGDLDAYRLATTRAGAEAEFRWFLEHALPHFGTYQDGLAEASPWLFHSLVSMYLNIGLLQPLQVCREVEAAWRADKCSLAAAEGFIRQVLGWREYVRGIYWHTAPEYAGRNQLQAQRPLPDWFWTADTDLRCLQRALEQSLDLGYAHHIQRLMVIGNFALLAGLDVPSVCQWYLAVYVDAFEWVELPNTLGMALHADGGLMASKPYAASGKYMQRQGDHCKACRYSPARVTGDGACPFNGLYWRFLHRHADLFSGNPRMGLALGNWQRKEVEEQRAILRWADQELQRLAPPA